MRKINKEMNDLRTNKHQERNQNKLVICIVIALEMYLMLTLLAIFTHRNMIGYPLNTSPGSRSHNKQLRKVDRYLRILIFEHVVSSRSQEYA